MMFGDLTSWFFGDLEWEPEKWNQSCHKLKNISLNILIITSALPMGFPPWLSRVQTVIVTLQYDDYWLTAPSSGFSFMGTS